MKYKIEIWKYHRIVDVYESDNIKNVLEWYKEEWQNIYNIGGCTFYLFKNGKELYFDEENELGFFD